MRVLCTLAIVGLGLCAVAACESDPDDDVPIEAISEDCDACLSREDCAPEWEACVDDANCETYVLCALQGLCYTRAPGSGCEEQRGCAVPEEAEAARSSAEFEACARTACGARCGFIAPEAE